MKWCLVRMRRVVIISCLASKLRRNKKLQFKDWSFGVGAEGFEPTTSSTRTKRATGLRYAPTVFGDGHYILGDRLLQARFEWGSNSRF